MAKINIPKTNTATRMAIQKLSSKIFDGLTLNGLLYYSDGRVTSLGEASNGQVPIGSTGNSPVLATLTGTANEIDITNAAGSITIGLVNPLIVGKGGTGAATLTDHSILLGSGTDAVTALGAATNGQLPIGSTGVDPVLAGLTGTANQITVTNGAGSITLSLPQDIATSSSPTFAAASLGTGELTCGSVNRATGNLTLETNGVVRLSCGSTYVLQTGDGNGTWNTFFPSQARAFVVEGNATESIYSNGGFVANNNRPTPASGDILGSFNMTSENNTNAIAAELVGWLDGSGGAAGFGGKFTIATKPDNVASTTTRISIHENGYVNIGSGSTKVGLLSVEGTCHLAETSSAIADTAGWGQIWVKNDAPNNLYFTNDVGTDVKLNNVIGTDVQAWGAVLDDLNTTGANSADSEFLVGTGAGALAWESGATVRTSIGLGTGDSPQFTYLLIQNSAVSQTPDPNACLVLKENDHTGINFLTATNKVVQFMFGDTDNAFQGGIRYWMDSDKMDFSTNRGVLGDVVQMVIDASGNIIVGNSTTVGTNAAHCLVVNTGTAPTTSPADRWQMYSTDFGGTAGHACPHILTEDGDTIKLEQQDKADYNNWAALSDVVDALVAMGIFDAA